MTKDSLPMMFSSYKSDKYETNKGESDREQCCCCSNNTYLYSQFRTLDQNMSKEPISRICSNIDSYQTDDRKKLYELERQVGYLMQDNNILREQKAKVEKAYDSEISALKTRLEKEKEDMKVQFQKYCEEIKTMYDQEKKNLKIKITELSSRLSVSEREKEGSNDVIKESIREVNYHYTQKIDYLQRELLETRTEASTRLIGLTKELNRLQAETKDKDEVITQLKAKLKEAKYNFDIKSRAASYRLEKSE